MATLWGSQDRQWKERRNREAIIGRLLYPVYEVDNTLATTLTPVVARVALAAAIGDVWSVHAGIYAALVQTITIVNTDTVSRTPLIYMIEPGQSAASVARTIWADPLVPGERVSIRVPFFMAAGAVIRGLGSAASVISVRVDALTFATQPAGLNLKIIEGAALGTTTATYYTCPSTGVAHAVLLASILCNTDTVQRTPEINLVPSGGGVAVSNQVWKDSMQPSEGVFLDEPLIILPGATVQAKASVAAVVAARFTVLELLYAA